MYYNSVAAHLWHFRYYFLWICKVKNRLTMTTESWMSQEASSNWIKWPDWDVILTVQLGKNLIWFVISIGTIHATNINRNLEAKALQLRKNPDNSVWENLDFDCFRSGRQLKPWSKAEIQTEKNKWDWDGMALLPSFIQDIVRLCEI